MAYGDHDQVRTVLYVTVYHSFFCDVPYVSWGFAVPWGCAEGANSWRCLMPLRCGGGAQEVPLRPEDVPRSGGRQGPEGGVRDLWGARIRGHALRQHRAAGEDAQRDTPGHHGRVRASPFGKKEEKCNRLPSSRSFLPLALLWFLRRSRLSRALLSFSHPLVVLTPCIAVPLPLCLSLGPCRGLGHQFAIRTPLTPSRWKDYDIEMTAGWQVSGVPPSPETQGHATFTCLCKWRQEGDV